MFVCLIKNTRAHASYRWPPTKLCSATLSRDGVGCLSVKPWCYWLWREERAYGRDCWDSLSNSNSNSRHIWNDKTLGRGHCWNRNLGLGADDWASLNGKCACGMNNSCANPCFGCNCDANDYEWREDSGLLTDKTKLPVTQLGHGDAGKDNQGYQALGKLNY